MNRLIPLNFNGNLIQADNNAWFNATLIGELHNKRLDKFFSLKRTQKYIELVANEQSLNTPKKGELELPFSIKNYPQLIKTKRGRYDSGTWLHPDLMILFARFISLEFERWCDKTIKALLIERKAWQPARQEAKQGFKLMNMAISITDNAHGKAPSKFIYPNEARRINKAICGKWGKLDRDNLTIKQLEIMTKAELLNATLYTIGKTKNERDIELSKLVKKELEVLQ